jgi:hypothetical protein
MNVALGGGRASQSVTRVESVAGDERERHSVRTSLTVIQKIKNKLLTRHFEFSYQRISDANFIYAMPQDPDSKCHE